MTSQNSNQNKNPYLDKLLDWYDKSKLEDQNEIKLQKENFVKSLKTINKEEIKNTIDTEPTDISLWKRIKKTLGIG
jgi:hypothetical protein